MSLSEYKNIPLYYKKLFLTFAQAYFSESYLFKWDPDIRLTKIIIADRFAIDLGKDLPMPALVLSRNQMGWGYVVRAQSAFNSANIDSNGITPLSNIIPNASYFAKNSKTDLLSSSITFTALSKNGIQAEMIANDIFVAITGMADALRAAGIFKITGMSIGAETLLKSDSEIRIVAVPINISFLTQELINITEKYYNIYVYTDRTELYETVDFIVTDNGTKIKFLTQTEITTDVKIDYTDAITLESNTGITLIPTSDFNVFLIPDNGKVLGYYDLLYDINIVENTLDE